MPRVEAGAANRPLAQEDQLGRFRFSTRIQLNARSICFDDREQALLRFAREKDIKTCLEISRAQAPRTPTDLDLRILVPAYILSEMKAGFQIGAVLFLPFLIIDLVVASVTLSIGMIQLPPVMISAPFKILLFVLVDGWNLVIGSLMKSFY